MHFGLTEEQDLLQNTVRDFAASEVPAARLREIFEEGSGYDDSIWRAAAEIGLTGLFVPERYGGVDLSLLDLALVFECLGEYAVPGPFLGHSLATLALVTGGSDAQRERWLPGLASGEIIGSFAIAEGDAIWDPEDWALRIEGGVASGAKDFVEHATGAKLFVVGASDGQLALVEADADGVSVTATEALDRTRSLGRVSFDGAAADVLPGGPAAADAVADAGRILLAADAFGGAWKLIRATVEYTLTRVQYGTPVAQFQGVKHQLANLAAEAEPMRGLIWYAAHAFDHIEKERAHSAAVAKSHITDGAVDIARACVELHGGIGFTWECDVQFWLKRALFDRTWLGSPAWHRRRIANLGGL